MDVPLPHCWWYPHASVVPSDSAVRLKSWKWYTCNAHGTTNRDTNAQHNSRRCRLTMTLTRRLQSTSTQAQTFTFTLHSHTHTHTPQRLQTHLEAVGRHATDEGAGGGVHGEHALLGLVFAALGLGVGSVSQRPRQRAVADVTQRGVRRLELVCVLALVGMLVLNMLAMLVPVLVMLVPACCCAAFTDCTAWVRLPLLHFTSVPLW